MSSRTRPSRGATKKVNYIEEEQADGMSSDLEEAVDDGDDAYGSQKQTKKAKKQRTGDGAAEEDDEFGKEGGKSKKRKQTKSKKASEIELKKPCFFDLLPFELVSEILSYTTPKDLLEFARTNNHYRSTLMSKTRSARIWKLARKTLGLPDLTADDFSEPAYAALVFGTRCDHCLRYAPAAADPWLRVRLCKPCRKENLIKIDARLDKECCRYHPATFDCVTRTPHNPSSGASCKWTLRSELEFYHKKLSTLQEEDDFDDTLETPGPPTTSENVPMRRRHFEVRKRKGRKVGPKFSYKERDQDESEPIVIKVNGRVSTFVAESCTVLEKISADAQAIDSKVDPALRLVRAEEEKIDKANRRAQYTTVYAVRWDLRQRLAQIEGYVSSDASYLDDKTLEAIVGPGVNLTEHLWTTSKERLLSAIDKAKKKEHGRRQKAERSSRTESRQRSCRPFYDLLKASYDDPTFFPLFTNFLLLPSVKALWKPADDEDEYTTVEEADWKLLRPLIETEVDEYQLDFVTTVIRLILSAHREFADEDALEATVQATLEGDLDTFFALASSLVVCGGGCRGKGVKVVQRYTTPYSIFARTTRQGKSGFVGSIFEVVAHLESKHNSTSVAEKRQTKPAFPVCLPLQVASTISALIELGDYSLTEATTQDLDLLDSGRYSYENAILARKRFRKWRDLVSAVSLAANKAEHRRPPMHLPAPLIGYYPSRR